jgi:hypothetical protein
VIRQAQEFFGVAVVELERINCHHNFTEEETHFGKRVWLSRKGAIWRSSVSRASSPVRWVRRHTS